MGLTGAVVFDLDDTLYLERDYVRSGFAAVADHVSRSDARLSSEVEAFLWNGFERGVRGRSFDLLIEQHPFVAERYTVNELISVYRRHRPRIAPIPAALALIEHLRRDATPLGVITDGPVESQTAKLESLGLWGVLDEVVMTDNWGIEFRKPHPRAFHEMESRLGKPTLVYVGDNPEKDFEAPRRLGWRTIRLRLAGQLRSHQEALYPEAAAEFDVNGFEDLQAVLGNL